MPTKAAPSGSGYISVVIMLVIVIYVLVSIGNKRIGCLVKLNEIT
jgi:hypothetical protein